jgi:lipopolysaccharide export system protein LptA
LSPWARPTSSSRVSEFGFSKRRNRAARGGRRARHGGAGADRSVDRPAADRPHGIARTARDWQRCASRSPAKAQPGDKGRLSYVADSATDDEATQTATLIGNVRLRYDGYTVTCDRATYDRNTDIVTFENNVVLSNGEETVYGDRVALDRRHQVFSSDEARTIIPPQLISASLLEPLRLSGKTIAREGRNLVATDGLLTTCDFPNPHYKIGFAKATVIPNDRIILRKASFYRYDRVVFRIAYLSLPIRDDIQYSYLPVVGRTDEEGYFVKNAVGYTLGKLLPGILRVDAMQRKGLGLGFDQAYRFGETAAGTLVLYSLHDRSRNANDLNYHVNHQQRIGETLTGITTDFQNNSYDALSPTSKTQNTTINSSRIIGNSNTTASLTLGTNAQGGSSGHANNYALSQTERFGATGNVTVKLSGSNTSNTFVSQTPQTDGSLLDSATSSGTVQQNGDLSAAGRLGIFDGILVANKILVSKLTGTNSGSGTPVYRGPEKLPDLTLSTDSERLKNVFLPGLFSAVPLRISFGYGRYADNAPATLLQPTGTASPQRVLSSRSLFDAAANPRPFSLTPGGALSLVVDGDFKQTVYSKDYAQYVLREDSTLSQRINANSSLNFVYGYLRPYGGAPTTFRFDQPGSVNNLGTNLALVSSTVRLTVGTGYDIQRARESATTLNGLPRDPWQTLSAQLGLKLASNLQTRFTSAYDINTGRLLSANNRLRIRGRGNFALDTSIDYDPLSHHLSQMSEVFQTPFFSRDLQLSALTGYNGVTKKFSYKSFGLVRSFHDYEYTVTYRDQPYGFRTERGFNIGIRLKAFPVLSTPQTGQYGSALDTGTADIF